MTFDALALSVLLAAGGSYVVAVLDVRQAFYTGDTKWTSAI
jgi:hypothetical protein